MPFGPARTEISRRLLAETVLAGKDIIQLPFWEVNIEKVFRRQLYKQLHFSLLFRLRKEHCLKQEPADPVL